MAEQANGSQSATPSVRGFSNMEYLYQGGKGYSHELTNLFEDQQRHKLLSFDDAKIKLIKTIENAFQNFETQTDRKVIEFMIGKTYVKQRKTKVHPFDVMNPITWRLDGGINGRWQSYKKDNFDGLFAIACIDKDTVPADITDTNHQWYTFVFEQTLIIHFKYSKKDRRIRNESTCTGGISKSFKGGIVYVAYKLEPEEDDNEAKYKYDEAALQLFRRKLEDNQLNFNTHIPMDGNSFFRACCDQLAGDDIDDTWDHTELRNMLYIKMKKQHKKGICHETYDKVLEIKKDGAYVDSNNFIEVLAQELDRPIFVYFLEDNVMDVAKFNEHPTESRPPLLLARDSVFYQSLRKSAAGERTPQSPPVLSSGNTPDIYENENYPSSSKKQKTCESRSVENNTNLTSVPKCNRYSQTRYLDVKQVYVPPVPEDVTQLSDISDYLYMLRDVLHLVGRRREDVAIKYVKNTSTAR